MPYLLDGYNLLYATGHLTAKTARHGLQSARKALLNQLVAGHGPDAGGVTVVFDAQAAPPGCRGEVEYRGIRVLFSQQGQSADDLIEQLIRDEPRPRLLTVVSDDHRIQQAARRRGCPVLGCLDYYERLQQRAIRPSTPVLDSQDSRPGALSGPEQMSPQETQRWLDIFKDADEHE